MTLKAVVEKLDDIPETLRDEYQERDGKFYLDLDDSLKVHTAVTPLANSLKSLKDDKKKLQERLDAANTKLAELPENFDADEYARLVEEEEQRKKDPNYKPGGNPEQLQRLKDQYEQRLRRAEEEKTAALAAKDTEIGERDGEIASLLIDDGLTKALVASGVGKEFLKASAAMLRSSAKVVVGEDGRRRAIVETDLGEQPLEQFVQGWAKTDEGKVFVTKPTGSDAPGSGRDKTSGDANPWAQTTVNVTEQGRLVRTDPTKARRLMKAAGLSEDRIARVLAPT